MRTGAAYAHRRAGFTLLEILLAVTLLSAIAVASASWMRLTARGVESLRSVQGETLDVRAAVHLLRDDLREASEVLLGDRGELRIATLHVVDGPHRRNRVVWSLEEDGRLVRSASDASGASATRTVLDGRRAGRFHRDEDGALWWLEGLTIDEPTQTASWRQLVWAAGW